jgi:hypothetical protein
MQTLPGKLITKANLKINELVDGYNTNVTNIASNLASITAILRGAVAEIVAAAGSVIGDATDLSASKFIHLVTGADATKGVQLPTGVAGDVHLVLNATNAVLKIYPQAAQKIDSGTAGAALSGTALYSYFMIYQDDTVGWTTTKFLVAD